MVAAWSPIHFKWLVLWSLWAGRLVQQPTPTLRVTGGLVRGRVAPDGSHAQYTGIPYARVVKRFQASEPATKWDGIFEAQNVHVRCTQRFYRYSVVGTEDCLTINVYTPLIASAQLLPVMIFIHGGGFRDGSGSPFLYGPDYLIKQGVILVTFNYRLEVIGFLCLGTKDAPGNVGLKDQVEALKWVKQNIEAFGGNPNDITLFGESAGSAAVVYHLVSPMSAGLFHKAIMQSGSAIAPWTLQVNPLATASALAYQMGLKTTDPKEIYKHFSNISAEKLMKTRVPRKEGDVLLSENIFVPCLEKKLPGVEPFLTDSPYNLLSSGNYHNVPIIIGYNNAEGYAFAARENDTVISKLDFYKALPRDLDFTSDKDARRTADILREYYMGSKAISKSTMVEFSRFEGDSGITYPVIATIELLANSHNNMPVFAYKFSYDGWMNLAKIVYGYTTYPGATHADELFYLFRVQFKLITALFEKEFIDFFTTMWTNFAKYGDPTPAVTSTTPVKWYPIDRRNPNVLEINKHCTVSPLWEDEIMLFWNSTYTKHRRQYGWPLETSD